MAGLFRSSMVFLTHWALRCSMCHSLTVPVQVRSSALGWQNWLLGVDMFSCCGLTLHKYRIDRCVRLSFPCRFHTSLTLSTLEIQLSCTWAHNPLWPFSFSPFLFFCCRRVSSDVQMILASVFSFPIPAVYNTQISLFPSHVSCESDFGQESLLCPISPHTEHRLGFAFHPVAFLSFHIFFNDRPTRERCKEVRLYLFFPFNAAYVRSHSSHSHTWVCTWIARRFDSSNGTPFFRPRFLGAVVSPSSSTTATPSSVSSLE